MKILLDESLPIQLRNDFGNENEVLTVKDMNWLSKKNGELLRLMIESNFEVFVTADRNLTYQHNTNTNSIIIVILRGVNNRLVTFRQLITKLLEILRQSNLPGIIEIS